MNFTKGDSEFNQTDLTIEVNNVSSATDSWDYYSGSAYDSTHSIYPGGYTLTATLSGGDSFDVKWKDNKNTADYSIIGNISNSTGTDVDKNLFALSGDQKTLIYHDSKPMYGYSVTSETVLGNTIYKVDYENAKEFQTSDIEVIRNKDNNSANISVSFDLSTPGTDGSVTIKGTAPYYTGTVKLTGYAVHADLADAAVTVPDEDKEVTLNGETTASGGTDTKKPTVTVKWGGNTVAESNYNKIYTYNDNASSEPALGTAKAYVIGLSEQSDIYLGSNYQTYKVVRKMAKLQVTIPIYETYDHTSNPVTKKIIDVDNNGNNQTDVDILTFDDRLRNLSYTDAKLAFKVLYENETDYEIPQGTVTITSASSTAQVSNHISNFSQVNSVYTVKVTDENGASISGTFKINPGHIYVTYNYSAGKTYTYDGESHTPEITVTNAADEVISNYYTINYNTSVDLTDGVPVNAQNVGYTIIGSSPYSGTVCTRNSTKEAYSDKGHLSVSGLNYVISPRSITDSGITVADIADYEYTQSTITPDVGITYNNSSSGQTYTLTQSTDGGSSGDFTVTSHGPNPGKYTVTIRGVNNYNEETTKTFTINKLNLSKYTAQLTMSNAVYKGEAYTLNNIFTGNQKVQLLQGSDSEEWSYGNFDYKFADSSYSSGITDVGHYTITLTPGTGKGDLYEGSVDVNFNINKRSLKYSGEKTLEGYISNPYTFGYSITLDGTAATKDTEKDNVYYVTGKEFWNSGNQVRPAVIVKDNNCKDTSTYQTPATLSDGTDYYLEYGTNTTAGKNTGLVRIRTNSDYKHYTDEVVVYFNIGKDIEESGFTAKVEPTPNQYNGKVQYPKVSVTDDKSVTKVIYDPELDPDGNGNVLSDFADRYKINWDGNYTDVGNYTVTVEGIGEYYGSITADSDYNIIPKDLSDYDFSVDLEGEDTYYYNNGNARLPAYFYNGKNIEPEIKSVTAKNKSGEEVTLISKSDYDYTTNYPGVSNSTYPGVSNSTELSTTGVPTNEPYVTITVKGNYSYTGTDPSASFVIMPHYLDKNDAVVFAETGSNWSDNKFKYYNKKTYIYKGTPVDPVTGLLLDGTDLITSGFGKSITNNGYVGDADVSINGERTSEVNDSGSQAYLDKNKDLPIYSGAGNLAGTLTDKFKIVGDLSDDDLLKISVRDQVYDEALATDADYKEYLVDNDGSFRKVQRKCDVS